MSFACRRLLGGVVSEVSCQRGVNLQLEPNSPISRSTDEPKKDDHAPTARCIEVKPKMPASGALQHGAKQAVLDRISHRRAAIHSAVSDLHLQTTRGAPSVHQGTEYAVLNSGTTAKSNYRGNDPIRRLTLTRS